MKGRGGFRQGAGRKPAWYNSETQTVRVPVALKDELMDIGKQLDQGQNVVHGRTNAQLQALLAEWSAKCSVNEGADWELVRQLLAEIETVLAQREMRGMRGRGYCHQGPGGQGREFNRCE